MPIEIKEVIIRTTVEKEPEMRPSMNRTNESLVLLKKEILKSCEQMIRKSLKQMTKR